MELEQQGSRDLRANVVKQAERAVAAELEALAVHRAEVAEYTATQAAVVHQRPKDP